MCLNAITEDQAHHFEPIINLAMGLVLFNLGLALTAQAGAAIALSESDNSNIQEHQSRRIL